MRIYNTLTRRKEEFRPLEENRVKIYWCGSTVYDHMHIGNARTHVMLDVVRRYFEYRGYDVTTVQNFTDVDDKLIKKANDENVSFGEIAERYIGSVMKEARELNVKDATHHPRVTDEMPEIIDMIDELVEKGYAYEANGTVYYETGKFPGYGKLSHKNIDDLIAGVRVDVSEEKKNPADFVLWKPAKPGEPSWESPWGPGRPGWHIECSAMAKKYLGDTIDIHGGAEDLIFPHHENEIAQSEAANGATFVNYWMHVRFLTMDHLKMSKSRGNLVTVTELSESFPADVIRFFYVSQNYGSPINFSEELLAAAANGLDRIKNSVANLSFIAENAVGAPVTDAESRLLDEAGSFKKDFINAMDDDFNSADAVTAIFELVKFANINVSGDSSAGFAASLLAMTEELCEVLGIKINNHRPADVEAEIGELIEQRSAARVNRDYATADKIRGSLLEKGIVLEDTPSGTKWSFHESLLERASDD